jgi:hypothetical protein
MPHIVREDSPRPHRPGRPQIAPAVVIDWLGEVGRLRPRRPDRRVLGHPESRAFAELLIDREEDRILRAVLVGMLLQM